MSEETNTNHGNEESFVNKYSFSIFIGLAILIAAVIVFISMAMYNSSGAAQLDLSRPGYKDVRAQAGKDDEAFQAYPPNGPISKDEIKKFKSAYDKQSKTIKDVDAFGGDPLSPESLGMQLKPVTE